MKQLIRKNTFETNSSSMHSLVITKTAKPYTKWEKELEYYGDKFELFGCCDTHTFERHPFEVLSSPKDKLRYYVAHYVGWKQEMHRLDEVEDLYRPYKEKKKTKATEAIKNGLEPLAKIIMSFPNDINIEEYKNYNIDIKVKRRDSYETFASQRSVDSAGAGHAPVHGPRRSLRHGHCHHLDEGFLQRHHR